MWCITQNDGHPIAGTEALKQSSLGNKVTRILHRDSSSVAVVESVMNFSALLQKEHIVFFRTALVVDTLQEMVSLKFLADNSP